MRSLSLLQQIFRIQESNQDLLHCCRILYQLSYQGTLRRNHPSLKKSTEISNKVGSMHAQSLIRVWLFGTPWSLPGSSVHGVFQARRLEWVAVSFTRGSSRLRDPAEVPGGSYTGRQILYHWATWETSKGQIPGGRKKKERKCLINTPAFSIPVLLPNSCGYMVREWFYQFSGILLWSRGCILSSQEGRGSSNPHCACGPVEAKL